VLNSDVGEGAGFDEQIMPYISWCNIACGEHAGTDETILETIHLAIQHGVKIGAHPSYPDRENFGRVSMDIPSDSLVATLTEQIQKVKTMTEELGGELHHVKPHGALYNDAVRDESVSRSILKSIQNVDKRLKIISPKDTVISYLCEDVLDVKHEVFADRNYKNDLSLVSRLEKNAVLEDPKNVFDHVFKMIIEGKVKTITGEEPLVFFDTICVHGDNPNSVKILEYIYREFLKRNFVLK